jgi:hypothetical protein
MAQIEKADDRERMTIEQVLELALPDETYSSKDLTDSASWVEFETR